jgi:predicted porin
MKKSHLALAVLGALSTALSSAALAQTNITVYGSFDGGLRNLTNVDASGDDKLSLSSNGTYNNNRLGFRGTEDLGGGLNAHFVLEAGFNSGNGTTADGSRLFNRTASVGVGSPWGTVDLGRQYSINFRTIGAYDPFNYKYPGILPTSTQGNTTLITTDANEVGTTLNRLDNDLQYTGTFGPVTARAEWAFGERDGSNRNGSTQAVGLAYEQGNFNVGAAYTQQRRQIGLASFNDFQDMRNWTAGGAIKLDRFRLAAGYADLKQEIGDFASDTRVKDAWGGVTFDFTPATSLTAAYYHTKYDVFGEDGKRGMIVVGGTYSLSRRTNLYAEVDTSKLTGVARGAIDQGRQTGVSVGVNHFF